MKRIWIFLPILLVTIAVVPGCTCQPEQTEDTQKPYSGFTNPEDLARVYLKAVEDKDMDALKTLIINPKDLKLMGLKRASDQHWMGYFSHNKRLFLTKNKDILGRKLRFLSFRSGTELKVNQDVSIFRGAQILAEQEDKKRVTLEINFLLRIKGFWKVLFLRYLHPRANVGQGPSLGPEATGKEPAMKVPGPKPKMELKVKKLDQEPAGQPPAADKPLEQETKESLDELKKLFEQ